VLDSIFSSENDDPDDCPRDCAADAVGRVRAQLLHAGSLVLGSIRLAGSRLVPLSLSHYH